MMMEPQFWQTTVIESDAVKVFSILFRAFIFTDFVMRTPQPSALAAMLAALFIPSGSLYAFETTFSGFGTLGWAQSNRSDSYLNSIDSDGTLHRDSKVGIQMDMRLNPQWSLTAQVTADAAENHDSAFNPRLKWAFMSYRPNNDWLIRAGKLRVGSLLYMQNMDQGVTYDWARLPAEVYSTVPSYDFTGLSIHRNWSNNDDLDLSVEGIWGRSSSHWRQWREGKGGADYLDMNITVKGLMLTLNREEQFYRLGWYEAKAETKEGVYFASEFHVMPNAIPYPPNELAGMGGTLLIPTVETSTRARGFSVGASIPLGPYTFTGEYVRRMINDIRTGPDSHAGYLAISRRVGQWTPYLMHARMISGSKERQERREATSAIPPSTGGLLPVVDSLIASEYASAASGIYVFDQYSWMLGTAYTLSPTQKLKLEWMRTRVGESSSLVDGGGSRSTRHVFSISYNFVF
jgi:hypothetical protein